MELMDFACNCICSLYRATNLEDAEEKFNAFVLRVPLMASLVKEVSWLQNEIDI